MLRCALHKRSAELHSGAVEEPKTALWRGRGAQSCALEQEERQAAPRREERDCALLRSAKLRPARKEFRAGGEERNCALIYECGAAIEERDCALVEEQKLCPAEEERRTGEEEGQEDERRLRPGERSAGKRSAV